MTKVKSPTTIEDGDSVRVKDPAHMYHNVRGTVLRCHPMTDGTRAYFVSFPIVGCNNPSHDFYLRYEQVAKVPVSTNAD